MFVIQDITVILQYHSILYLVLLELIIQCLVNLFVWHVLQVNSVINYH